MKKIKVHCLGPAGTYGHEVAKKIFGDSIGKIEMHKSNQSVLHALEKDPDTNSYGVVPVENSTSGAGLVSDVVPNFWLPRIKDQPEIKVVGEYRHEIKHVLASPTSFMKNGIPKVKRIFSHPQALMQCAGNIKEIEKKLGYSLDLIPTTSTAGSIEKITEPTDAAICSEFAALNSDCLIGDLRLICNPFNDDDFNQTTFHLLSKTEISGEVTHSAVLFDLDDRPHALVDALQCISGYNANMHMIHSIPVGPSRYAFYIEFDEPKESKKGRRIFKAFERVVSNLLCLGSFEIINERKTS
ncbi:MAG: prephenate dehydratase [bacterium]